MDEGEVGGAAVGAVEAACDSPGFGVEVGGEFYDFYGWDMG